MNDINAQIQEIKDVVLDLTSALEEQYGYEPGYLRGEEACTSFAEYPRLVREIPKMDSEINAQIEDLENRIIALEEIDHDLYRDGDIETFTSSKNYTDEKFNSVKTDLSHLDEKIKNISINTESIDKKIDDKIIELDLSNTYDTKGSAFSAEINAKTYTDDKASLLDGRIKVLESIDHDAYKTTDNKIIADIKSIQDELESLSGGAGSIDTQISNKIATLDVSDAEVSGQYVSAVKQTDGKISVTRTALPNYANTYDTKGSANSALTSAKAYTDQEINKLSFDASGSAASALSSAKTYADNLNTAMDTRVYALEASKDAYKAADNALEATLKTYVDNHVPDVPITVDSELSSTSTNPVQNKVIANALSSVQIKKENLIITEDSESTITLQPNVIYDINLEARESEVNIKLSGDMSDYHMLTLTLGATAPTVNMTYSTGYNTLRWLDGYNVLKVLYPHTVCQITVFNNCASGGIYA